MTRKSILTRVTDYFSNTTESKFVTSDDFTQLDEVRILILQMAFDDKSKITLQRGQILEIVFSESFFNAYIKVASSKYSFKYIVFQMQAYVVEVAQSINELN